ncbi:NAD-dependent epimerase/dehydratase family protein [Algiphilus sp.]|uniref:NAD-dependent epimerase/dehydratase family protein n=1 Tax=Algiphilus sp. TaxID=1872431 RepID=UPI003B51B938
MARILLTGAAGFIGFHTARALCTRGDELVGFDNCNHYYDPALKEARLAELATLPNFRFHRAALEDRAALDAAMADAQPHVVIHLAAQAGVRYSIDHPKAYLDSNLAGFHNVLECCRHHDGLQHLVFASSSSVYGANTTVPFSTTDRTDYPISLYAATKKANEVTAHAYSHLYGIPVTGLRFFTVYGPWGRPDMAYFSFTKAILEGQPIQIFNHGQLERDFTYIDDIVEGVVRLADRPPTTAVGAQGDYRSDARFALHNIGNHQPVALGDFIATLEDLCGLEAVKEYLPMQPGDVHATYADVESLKQAVGFEPKTPLRAGLERFVSWYRSYYGA